MNTLIYLVHSSGKNSSVIIFVPHMMPPTFPHTDVYQLSNPKANMNLSKNLHISQQIASVGPIFLRFSSFSQIASINFSCKKKTDIIVLIHWGITNRSITTRKLHTAAENKKTNKATAL